VRGDKLVIEPWHVKVALEARELLLPHITGNEGRFVITIAGESGSGKTEIAAVLSQSLSELGVGNIILQQDDYFVYPPRTNEQVRRKDITSAGPGEVHLDLLDQNLADILEGRSQITKPLVVFEEDRITEETVSLDGVQAVIVEGTYTSALKNAHRRLFIDRTYVDTRETRRLRARETQDAFLEKVLEIEHGIISSHRSRADIIITRDYEVRENGARERPHA